MDGDRIPLDGLVGAAADAGLPASERLVKDWVGKGLLDRATERGRGRGAGFDRTWSTEQRDLLLDLLHQRGAGRSVRDLTNVVAARWLAGHPVVPTRQVRRALATWALPTGQVSARASRIVARELVARLRPDGARRQAWTELTEVVADALLIDATQAQHTETKQTSLDRDTATNSLDRIMKVDQRVSLGTAPQYQAHLLEVQLTALASIAHARTLDRRGAPPDEYLDWLDERLEQARLLTVINNTTTETLGISHLAIDPTAFERDACLRLLPNLGMEIRHPHD